MRIAKDCIILDKINRDFHYVVQNSQRLLLYCLRSQGIVNKLVRIARDRIVTFTGFAINLTSYYEFVVDVLYLKARPSPCWGLIKFDFKYKYINKISILFDHVYCLKNYIYLFNTIL